MMSVVMCRIKKRVTALHADRACECKKYLLVTFVSLAARVLGANVLLDSEERFDDVLLVVVDVVVVASFIIGSMVNF